MQHRTKERRKKEISGEAGGFAVDCNLFVQEIDIVNCIWD